jgi:hypothetical protein
MLIENILDIVCINILLEKTFGNFLFERKINISIFEHAVDKRFSNADGEKLEHFRYFSDNRVQYYKL